MYGMCTLHLVDWNIYMKYMVHVGKYILDDGFLLVVNQINSAPLGYPKANLGIFELMMFPYPTKVGRCMLVMWSIFWNYPPTQDAGSSIPGLWTIFSRESQPKPSFVTIDILDGGINWKCILGWNMLFYCKESSLKGAEMMTDDWSTSPPSEIMVWGQGLVKGKPWIVVSPQ